MLGCSALKERYRRRLAVGVADFRIVYLHGAAELLRERIKARQHRYMPAALLDSQLATLEPPSDAIAVDVAATPEQCLAAILTELRKS